MTIEPHLLPKTSPAHSLSHRVVYLADHPHLAGTVASWIYREWPPGVDRPFAQTLSEVRRRTNRQRLPLTLIAVVRTQPVGTASIIEDIWPEPFDVLPFLVNVYVLPAWRGCRIGTQLCQAAIEVSQSLELSRLCLGTADKAAFYSRLGWSTSMDGQTPVVGDGLVFMQRTLAPKSSAFPREAHAPES